MYTKTNIKKKQYEICHCLVSTKAPQVKRKTSFHVTKSTRATQFIAKDGTKIVSADVTEPSHFAHIRHHRRMQRQANIDKSFRQSVDDCVYSVRAWTFR